MSHQNILEQIKERVENKTDILHEANNEHSRYEVNAKNYRQILIKNIPFIFTCDADDHLICLKNYSIAIKNDLITELEPLEKIKEKKFDIIYDAGKRGGIVVTPGLINGHAHIHMYLLRSALVLDEEKSVDDTIANMAKWQRFEDEEALFYAAIGDLTEQQKNGITTTLTHGPSFNAGEIAAKITQHNLINAVSAVSNSRPTNSPEMVEELLAQKKKFYSTPAISLHYLYKTPPTTLDKVKKIIEKYQTLLTVHMAESQNVAAITVKEQGMSEVALLKKFDLLNNRTIVSHSIYVSPEEIVEMSKNQIGIVHLPTSNAIHKSGIFPFWQFNDANGYKNICLGTDSVVSKSKLDLLTEAYQARITHLYSRTIKYGTLFKMMTMNGARVLNLHDRGKILPGMKADLVFWKLRDRGFIPYDEENPMTLIGNLITHGGRSVRDLMINGKFIIKGRRHQFVDETQLLNTLQKKHMAMRQRKK
ncbi:MAG: amidohydrolase family protein [Patescibacteria group bacterium]|nr:amidohydrolase family protein [Patescibacteria group bacterium]MDD4610681.1 amidohydrolase family protein [Patescibacteria group bacterium]